MKIFRAAAAACALLTAAPLECAAFAHASASASSSSSSYSALQAGTAAASVVLPRLREVRASRAVVLGAAADASAASSGDDESALAADISAAKSLAQSVRGGKAAPASGLKQRLKLGLYFFLWYTLNIGYNITNKKTLNMARIPFTLSAYQLLVGSLYVLPLWFTGLRKAPKLTAEEIKTVSPMGFAHMCSHLSAVVALGAGAVSFTHIVKAAEPLFTALLSAVFLGQIFPLPVYLALFPVIGGVGLASLHELDFSWVAFGGAMASNLAASSRGILAKKSMGKPVGTNMTPANLYAVLTMIATALLIPIAAIFEGPNFAALWDAAIAKGFTAKAIAIQATLSGVFFYLYNEVAFMALNEVHPVTHAVGNTFKRVFIIATSILVFRTPVTTQGIIGSAVAITGVMVYSLLKNYYATKKN